MNIAMTDKNSIVPPRELVQHWFNEASSDHLPLDLHIAARAAEWGRDQANHDIERKLQEARDQELEACCEVVSHWYGDWVNGIHLPTMLRAARRPKPLSLKQQAQEALQKALVAWMTNRHDEDMFREYGTIINRALEQLPDD